MYNDVDIEMAELTAAANHAHAQRLGSVDLTSEVKAAIISEAVSHLLYTGGESSFDAVMSAVEDRPEVCISTDAIGDMQWIAWERFLKEDNDENWG